MTRQQGMFIIVVNAIISLVVSLAVTWFMTRGAAPTERLPSEIPLATPVTEPTSLLQPSPTGQTVLPGRPTPIVHVVEPGDTLFWIAQKYGVSPERIIEENSLTDPDSLAVGEELIIPQPPAEAPVEEEVPPSPTEALLASPTATATGAMPRTATPVATPTQEEVELVITDIVAPGRHEAEVLVLANYGRDVRLQGWTLSNDRGQVYTLPNLVLFSGNSIRIWTIKGRNTPSDLYWGLGSAAWGPEIEVATLKDSEGEVQATYEID